MSAGSAAINYAILTIAEAGDNIVATPQLYGGTYTLFAHMLPKQGIEVRFADSDSPADLEKLIDDSTRAVFCESIGNPAGNIVDLEALADMAHDRGVPLIVDNTVATPALIKPLEWGADVVVSSLTKYMGGHGNALGGMIVDGGEFPWKDYPEKFHMLNTPEASYHGVVYTDVFGAAAYAGRARTVALRNTGAALSPMNAFLILQGMQTLPLRMERHCQNAWAVAEYLKDHKKVEWVRYPGLPGDRAHALNEKYLSGMGGPMVVFEIEGGQAAGRSFIEGVELFAHLANVGDAKSLAIHPATTTHSQLNEEQQEKAGVTQDLIRLSVGLEDLGDLKADIEQAFEHLH